MCLHVWYRPFLCDSAYVLFLTVNFAVLGKCVCVGGVHLNLNLSFIIAWLSELSHIYLREFSRGSYLPARALKIEFA